MLFYGTVSLDGPKQQEFRYDSVASHVYCQITTKVLQYLFYTAVKRLILNNLHFRNKTLTDIVALTAKIIPKQAKALLTRVSENSVVIFPSE